MDTQTPTRDEVEAGVRQIEQFLRRRDYDGAELAFALTAGGLVAHADSAQVDRLQAAAKTLGLAFEVPGTETAPGSGPCR